ncbi:AzlD domain-containing protein [Carnimonas bestiolae]|uniref:AzlD domain-containing protein n=1 Tax=Carnimonas bestiolae TaxID=3402172 RepID=UPI003EDB73F6
MSFSDTAPAILMMAAITYLFRLLPLLMRKQTNELFGERLNNALSALGPSLLVAIAVTTVVPDLMEKAQQSPSQLLLYVLGLAAVLLIHRLINNVGVTILLAMLLYGGLNASGLF